MTGWSRLVARGRQLVRGISGLCIVVASVTSGLGPTGAGSVLASHTGLKFPFPAGSDWYISQGYNTSPEEGWSHFNCDPKRLLDEISHTAPCEAGWQYKYAFDLRRADGDTVGQPVLSPTDGTIRWIDETYGGMSIDLGDGYAVAIFHADLAHGLKVDQPVRQGQRLGAVAPPGGGGNGGTPHIHLTLWQTEDGGNWSRLAVPFTDDHAIDGYDFPAASDRERNQHWNESVVSSNVLLAATEAPAAPTPIAPNSGTVFTVPDNEPVLTWEPTVDAVEYQVVLNGGEESSGWLSDTTWPANSLAPGEYTWQVVARNDRGESELSDPWSFSIERRAGSKDGVAQDARKSSDARESTGKARGDGRKSERDASQSDEIDAPSPIESKHETDEQSSLTFEVPVPRGLLAVDEQSNAKDGTTLTSDPNHAESASLLESFPVGPSEAKKRDRARRSEQRDHRQTAPAESGSAPGPTDGTTVSTTATGESGVSERSGGDPTRKERDRKDRHRNDEAEPGAESDRAEPTSDAETPVGEEPTAEPPATTSPARTDLIFVPVADTAVFATDPDAAQGRNQATALHVGGPSVAMTYITFQIIGAEEGSVVAARLILTGAGETAGAGGVVSILPEVWIDEAHMTFSNAPAYGGAAALTATGDPATYQSLEPGREIAIDISGSVTGDGVLTFVLVGTPDVVAAIASRESESPPRLIVTVEPTG